MMDCLVGKAEAPDRAQPANTISPEESLCLESVLSRKNGTHSA